MLNRFMGLLARLVGILSKKDPSSGKRAGLMGMYFQESNGRRNKMNRERQ
jgi:hypothetical protein